MRSDGALYLWQEPGNRSAIYIVTAKNLDQRNASIRPCEWWRQTWAHSTKCALHARIISSHHAFFRTCERRAIRLSEHLYIYIDRVDSQGKIKYSFVGFFYGCCFLCWIMLFLLCIHTYQYSKKRAVCLFANVLLMCYRFYEVRCLCFCIYFQL